ncbi:MAG: copper chaperone PCu(A)C [Betaproteobacteria bacterium]|nr:copper chaperone PCu(A)C [Betaproteobacteria bacterium]
MMKFRLPMILATMLFAASAAHAQVDIANPWVRATVSEQKTTGVFMKITSKADAKLVSVRTALAGRTEIHEMAMEGDTMKMRQIPNLPLPAGATVELKPGGLHIMLFELTAQAKEGDTVPLTLVIETGGKQETVEVSAAVRPLKKPAHH